MVVHLRLILVPSSPALQVRRSMFRLHYSTTPFLERFPHQVRHVRHRDWTTPPYHAKLIPIWVRPVSSPERRKIDAGLSDGARLYPKDQPQRVGLSNRVIYTPSAGRLAA